MPRSKSGLTCTRTKGNENDGMVNWCKHVCRFPSPLTTHPDYKAWRDAVFHRMQQDRIGSWALATPEQWAAIQAYGLSLEPLASNGRAALRQEDTRSGQRITECYDYLLKEIAKKHLRTLACLGAALPPAVLVAPALAANNGKFRPLSVRINLHVKVLI